MLNVHDIAFIGVLASGILFCTTVGFAIAWVLSREEILRMRAEHASLPQRHDTARFEHAVEAIAIEVERVAEGQRFVNKVLAERVPPSAMLQRAEPPRSITPH